MATKAEAKQQAGELLKLVATGQSIPSEYDSVLGAAYEEVYARLSVLNLADWDESEAMPSEVVRPFVGLMALYKKDQVGVSPATESKIFQITGVDGTFAEMSISEMIVDDWEDLEEPQDYM